MATLGRVTDDPGVPFSVRIGARLPDKELWEGVPDWLLKPLLDWLEGHLDTGSAKQLALRQRLSVPEPAWAEQDVTARA
jgi:hypothetical protein